MTVGDCGNFDVWNGWFSEVMQIDSPLSHDYITIMTMDKLSWGKLRFIGKGLLD